jgi:multidrug resistance efflux pump
MKWAASHLKISWILALLVVIGCLLGANHIMRGPHGIDLNIGNREQPGEKKNATRTPSGQKFVATAPGAVAPENEIVQLFPSVKGEVKEIRIKSDQQVKKDQVLLVMDDRFADIQLKKAEAAVEVAKAKLTMARLAPADLKSKRNKQLSAIEDAKLKRDSQKEIVEKLKQAADAKTSSTAEVNYNTAQRILREAEINIKVQEETLNEIDQQIPTLDAQIELAASNLKAQELTRDEAKLNLDLHQLKAPADGTIMQSFASVGTKFGDTPVRPAFLFYSGGLIVKAEVSQEFAHKVKEGQIVVIEDAAGSGQTWNGHVTKVDNKFTIKRESTIPNLIEQNQDPILETRITLDPGQTTPLLYQKVRVYFK